MKKVTVIGHFGTENSSDGQTIKTKTITKALEQKYGPNDVIKIDTHGGLKTLLNARKIVNTAFKNSKNVIILPAENGLRVFAPLCAIKKRRSSSVKLHYVVVGGWLPKFIQKHKLLEAPLKQFDGIYVETSTMKRSLETMGFTNAVVMPNCKDLTILSEEDLVYSTGEPLKLCTFSRIMREKGIEDAINAVTTINSKYGRKVYTLDIYGQVDPNQKEWFEELESNFSDYIRYNGIIPYEKSVDTIKSYYALLFPTHFYTEGIPGTVLDAFAAGVPVIASKWENFKDLIEDGVTGIGFEYSDEDGLINTLEFLAENPETLNPMRINCILNAKKYTPDRIIEILVGGGKTET